MKALFRICRPVIVAVLACAVTTGCQAPHQPQTDTRARAATTDFDFVWNNSINVLRQMNFEPDRQDRANREIVSRHETSAQWHEFWRRDVADPDSLLYASLHTTQRRVILQLHPSAGEGWEIKVRVDVFRKSQPERQVTTASSAVNIFAARSPTAGDETLFAAGARGTLVPMGRDAALEARIAGRIQQACGGSVSLTTPASAPTTEPSEG